MGDKLNKLLQVHAAWMGEKWEHFLVFRAKNDGNAGFHWYRVDKHSTRSKYRGYKISSMEARWSEYVFKPIAKNLTKTELIGMIKLLRGE